MTYPAQDLRLIVEPGFWELSPEARSDICNGCGSKTAAVDLIPDCILGANVKLACDIHDYAYWLGLDKAKADRDFLSNMLMLCLCNNKAVFLARSRIAFGYFEAVTLLGGPSFGGHK